MTADLSVVICSLNGAAGVDRCLHALAAQDDVDLQIIVVDDGSTDDTSGTAARHGVTVIRHETNRGLAAARNTGIAAATAPVVAFLDDDCEPDAKWARNLIAAYDEDSVIGAGGSIEVCGPDGFMLEYLRRNNPLLPLELDLAQSDNLLYRLYRYALRQWRPEERHDRRDVYSLVGANMSFTRRVLQHGGFDERFRFGAEDLDLCLQLPRKFPGARLVVTPEAVVRHHFVPSLRDTVRRSRSYGRGCARLYRKWPSMPPTIFPGPVLVIALLIASVFFPLLLVAAAVIPLLLYPKGLRLAVVLRKPACLLDSYVQLAEEAYGNVGYIRGLWIYRHLVPETSPATTDAQLPQAATSAGHSTWE